MAEILVDAKSRADRGKNAARRLRASGRIPAIVYGGKKDALAVSVDPKTLLRVLRSESGRNTILSLDLGDAGKASAILKSWQVDPINEKFIHADFYRIAMDVAIRVKIPILAKGEARGVKVDALFFPDDYRPALPHEYQFHLDTGAGREALDRTVRFLKATAY